MLEQFERSTRLQCCATCTHWYAKKRDVYCPELDINLVNDLESIGCSYYRQEQIEGIAVQTYLRLLKNGAK